MKLPELRIADLIPRFPIVQGGMAVRVSTASLAGAVAKNGGIGVIGATGMGLEELKREINEAKKIAAGGIVGVNIMFAARQFSELVNTAIKEGIDVIFTGAGFSRDIFRWGRESATPIVPIVSSVKAARIAEKSGAAAVVVEGTEAGGHLGTDRSIREILPEIKEVVNIPVIAAGGIVDGKDMADMVKLGADGVQMASRFVLSEECNVSDEFKQMYLQAGEEDVVLIKSPVGLPGRALVNPFAKKIIEGNAPKPEKCDKCLKHCSYDYCIMQALTNSRDGKVDEGVVFSGQSIARLNDILPVERIFEKILKEYASI